MRQAWGPTQATLPGLNDEHVSHVSVCADVIFLPRGHVHAAMYTRDGDLNNLLWGSQYY